MRVGIIIGVVGSIAVHGLFWGTKMTESKPAEVEFDQGLVSVELTLMPAMDSTATAVEVVPPEPIFEEMMETEVVEEPPEVIQEAFEDVVELVEGNELVEEVLIAEVPMPTLEETREDEALEPLTEKPIEVPSEVSEAEVFEEKIQPDMIAQNSTLQESKGARSDAVSDSPIRPVYPRVSLRLGEEGTVVASIRVDARGLGSEIRILQSSGKSRLDQAVIKALRKARFSPALEGGKPVASTLEKTFRFRLNDE